MGLELASAFIRIRADNSMLVPGLRQTRGMVTGQLREIAHVVAGVFGGGLLYQFEQGVARAVGSMVTATINLAGRAEELQIAFETMLGSAEKAAFMMREIKSFARRTPFGFEGAAQSAKQLLAVGISAREVIPELTRLGNVASALSVPIHRLIHNYGQIRAAGRLMAIELRDFVRAGIPLIEELAKQLRVSESQIKKMTEEGQISFEDVRQAFINMTSEGGRFFELMERRANTLPGRIDQMQDAFAELGRVIGGELLPLMKDAAQAMADWADESKRAAKETSSLASATINAVMAMIKSEQIGTLNRKAAASELNDFYMALLSQFGTFSANIGAGLVAGFQKIIKLFLMHIMDLIKAAAAGADAINKALLSPFTKGTAIEAIDKGLDNIQKIFDENEKKTKEILEGGDPFGFSNAFQGMDMKISERTKQLKIQLEDAIRDALDIANEADAPKNIGNKIGDAALKRMEEGTDLFGRFGFAEIAAKFQDAVIKGEDTQLRMVGALELGNRIQDQMLGELRRFNAKTETEVIGGLL